MWVSPPRPGQVVSNYKIIQESTAASRTLGSFQNSRSLLVQPEPGLKPVPIFLRSAFPCLWRKSNLTHWPWTFHPRTFSCIHFPSQRTRPSYTGNSCLELPLPKRDGDVDVQKPMLAVTHPVRRPRWQKFQHGWTQVGRATEVNRVGRNLDSVQTSNT